MIIGFAGPAGSGKDTLAQYLKVTHKFQQVAFSDPIKSFCRRVFKFSSEQLYGPSTLRNEVCDRFREKQVWEDILIQLHTFGGEWIYQITGESNREMFLSLVSLIEDLADRREPLAARHVLQAIGTEWARAHDPNIWINYAMRRVKNMDNAVITDVRFLNELEAVQAAGGVVIRLLRDLKTEDGFYKHLSETELLSIPVEKFDKVLDNNRELIYVYEDLDEVVYEGTAY